MTNAVRLATVLLSLTCCMATTALAFAQDGPDLGSATRQPPPYTDYEITDDGFLIYQGDMAVGCRSLLEVADSPNSPLIKEQVKLCTEAGFPPKGSLPETGGPRLDAFPTLDDGTCPAPLVERRGVCFPG